jgi:hypothetical protein
MVSVHDEAADQHEGFCIDVFREYDMGPRNCAAVNIRNEKLLIVPAENPRQAIGGVPLREVVAELCR